MLNSITKNFPETIYEGRGVPLKPVDSIMGKLISHIFFNSSSIPVEGSFKKKLIKNVLIQTSPEFKTLFQKELQKILLDAFENRESIKDEHLTLFVHHIISLFPFAYPDEGFEMKVPIKMDTEWRLATYKLDQKIPLGHPFLLSSIPAYSFKSSDGSPPMLIFIGTTYPAGEGFLGTLLSDFTPGISVGGLASFCTRKKLGVWFKNNPGAIVTGISLGGALSLSAAKHFGENISKVYAFLPPGFYPWELKSFANTKTKINLIFHQGDIVSRLGFFPQGENVKLYQINGTRKTNWLSAHARVFLGSDKLHIFSGSIQNENHRISRKILTLAHLILSPLIFLCILPGYFVSTFFKLISRKISHMKSIKPFSLLITKCFCKNISDYPCLPFLEIYTNLHMRRFE